MVFEIPSMPNYFRRSIDGTVKEVKELWSLGIKSILIFVKAADDTKDNTGKESWNPDGLMQREIASYNHAHPTFAEVAGSTIGDVGLETF